MNGKLCVLAVLALAAVGAGVYALADPPGQAASRESYRRPAEIPFPEDNRFSKAKADLGQMLFFDPILSGPRTRSCGTCHDPALAWGDGRPRAVGERPLALRSPTLLAIAWIPRLGWDGKFRDLESVAFGPINSPANMNFSEAGLIERLGTMPRYVEAFAAAFGPNAINKRNIELALATFERTIVPEPTPFDRWIEGEPSAISAAARRGFELFNGKARCAACHSGYAFSDGSFHDIGTAREDDIGRGRMFPNSVKLRYAFKTPTLREVTRRAPYMHDGSIATLEDVIDLYDRGGIERPSRSVLIRPLGLTTDEKVDLIAFLDALTSAPKPVSLRMAPH
jgi:cytochrome c peroxidase